MSRFSGQFTAWLRHPVARQPARTVIFASAKMATNRCGADILRLPWGARRNRPFHPLQGSEALLYAARCGPCSALFLGSSAVEHSTVNRMVAGSNPARGASKIKHLAENQRSSKKRRVGTVLANRLPSALALADMRRQARDGPTVAAGESGSCGPSWAGRSAPAHGRVSGPWASAYPVPLQCSLRRWSAGSRPRAG